MHRDKINERCNLELQKFYDRYIIVKLDSNIKMHEQSMLLVLQHGWTITYRQQWKEHNQPYN
jgi:hypothetical protein